ncbi:MAG TPA: DUF2163 domain-containing protein [Phenylobacterium sp.]|nr:DUF2163 domain-containing protein [Phenylobacterium sp.]
MRALPEGMAAQLASGASRLCHAWILTRADGATLGFTDHDRDLVVEGVTCRAATGWTLGAADTELGLAAGTAAARAALDDAAITAEDLDQGLYDEAEVVCRRVDWADPAVGVELWRGRVRRIKREGAGFTAEVEGPLAALDRVVGRTFGRVCDANLGDGRCQAAVDGPAFNGTGAVVSVRDGRWLTVSGLGGFAAGWFAGGVLSWTSGAGAGRAVAVAAHESGGVLALAAATVFAVAPGDAFEVRAGCDKRAATCAAKFGNLINFQGFPTIPGDDFIAAFPGAGETHDGGRR